MNKKRYRIFGGKFSEHLMPIGLATKLKFIIRVQLSENETLIFEQRVSVNILQYADANCFALVHEPKRLFETAPLFAQYGEPLFFEFNAN